MTFRSNDAFIGNNGQDYLVIQTSFGSAQVLDFIDGTDLIGLGGGLTFADLSITGSNDDPLIPSNNELLATLTGVDSILIDRADLTMLVSIKPVVKPLHKGLTNSQKS